MICTADEMLRERYTSLVFVKIDDAQGQLFFSESSEHGVAKFPALYLWRGNVGEELLELLRLGKHLSIMGLLLTLKELALGLLCLLLADKRGFLPSLLKIALIVAVGCIGAEETQDQRDERRRQSRDFVPSVFRLRPIDAASTGRKVVSLLDAHGDRYVLHGRTHGWGSAAGVNLSMPAAYLG